jgi:hypothetical protein
MGEAVIPLVIARETRGAGLLDAHTDTLMLLGSTELALDPVALHDFRHLNLLQSGQPTYR